MNLRTELRWVQVGTMNRNCNIRIVLNSEILLYLNMPGTMDFG